MNVTRIPSINFMSRIIDSHAHIGTHNNNVYNKNQLDVFTKSDLSNGDSVKKIIVSDLDVLSGLKEEFEGNKMLLNTFKNDNNYSLIASCNPKNGKVDNIKRLFNEYPNNFLGLKFHPDIQQLELSDYRYNAYMEFASQKQLPCLFHCQVKLLEDGRLNTKLKHISDPENIYNLAKKHSKTPVVLAHLGAGWNESHDKTIDIIIESIRKGDANLYADVSWVDIDNQHTHIVKAIKRLKGIGEKDWSYGDQSYRLMFGSDAPLARFKDAKAKETYTQYIEAIKSSIRKDKDLSANAEKIIEDLFYNNAEKLYLTSQNKTKPKKSLIFIGIFTGISIACGLLYKNLKTKNKEQ